jgi:hypothetical protein
MAEYSLVVDALGDELIIEVDGRQGPPGPPGPPGQDGTEGAGATYEHTQSSASDAWIVNHGLGRRPAVTVLDISGAEIEVDIRHMSLNQCRVYLSVPTVGTVICS